MGENQGIDKVLEKLSQLFKANNKDNLILMGKGSDGMLEISVEELEKLKNLRRVERDIENTGMTTVLGTACQASTFPHVSKSKWILDSGASPHVTGTSSEFTTFTPYSSTCKETIQIADGTSQPVRGVGDVQCTPSIMLSSVLYAPSFPVNLISMNSLVDHMDCRITVDLHNCLIEERKTRKKLGTGTRYNGLWYLDRRRTDRVICSALAVATSETEAKVILLHCRLGHLSFDTMSKVFLMS